MNNLSRTDKILLVFLNIITAMMLYLLNNEKLLITQSEEQLPQIGKFTIAKNDVRRKGYSSFAWLPSSNKDIIHEKDSLFTGDNSQAQIDFTDGGILYVDSNSLIILSQENGEINLDLKFGEFKGEIAKGKKINITNGTEKYQITNTDTNKSVVKLGKNQFGEINLEMIQGKTKFKSKNNEKEVSTSNGQMALTKEDLKPALLKEEVRLNLKSKTNNLFNSTTPAVLAGEWSQSFLTDNVEAQLIVKSNSNESVKSNPNESDSVFQKNLQSLQFNEVLDLKPGQYYVQVNAKNKNQKIISSNIETFIVIANPPPEIETPINGFNYPLSKGEVLPVELKINTHGIKYSRFEIETSIGNKISLIEIQKELFKINLNLGEFKFKIRGKNETAVSDWSKEYIFVGLEKEKTSIPAPVLVNGKTTINNESNSSFEINWKYMDDSQFAIVEVDNSSKFKNTQPIQVKGPRWTLQNLKPGNYFYRVKAQDKNLFSPYSQTGELKVTTNTAPILSLNNIKNNRTIASKELPNYSAVWNNIGEILQYEINISGITNKRTPFNQNYSTSNLNFKLPSLIEGQYKIKVRAISSVDSASLSPFSNEVDFLITSGNQLPAPQLIEPQNKFSIFAQSLNGFKITLGWSQPSESSTGYLVEISQKSDFSSILMSEKTKKTSFNFSQFSKPGIYFWRVKTLGNISEEDSFWSETFSFHLKYNNNSIFEEEDGTQ